MPKPISFGKIEVNVVSTMEESHSLPEPETPFRIAILGDFSGRENRGITETLVNRRFHLIDRDNLDEVLSKLGVEINLPILGKNSPPVNLQFSELDDFHPDHLFKNLEVFKALKETRQGLKDPSTVALLAKKFQTTEKAPEHVVDKKDNENIITSRPPLEKGGKGGFERLISGETTGGLLDQILEETETEEPNAESSQRTSEWDKFLKEIVKPHLVLDIENQQAKMISSVDAATSELMRIILHHPDFQAIEAAWRGLYFLTSRLDTDSQLKLYILDVSKSELAADLFASDDLRSTGIYKLLIEQTVETPGGEPWAVLAGNYTFDATREDAEVLGRMAKIARQAGTPFISAANAHLLSCESLAETPDPDNWRWMADEESINAWEKFRRIHEASYLGLALPRFLLRLPYGEGTDPIEQFDFEEMPGDPVHDYYLWGNPSFACVYLLARAFSKYGWDFRPGIIHDIECLPLHIYKEQGESRVKPCAEVVLTERASEIILQKGIMPLLSFKNQDKIRVARFQSLADPPTNLAGRWR